jgi:hypothetical protein
MFQGLSVARIDNYIFLNKKRCWFKLLDFYTATSLQQQELLSNLNPGTIVGCHRQYQFDFGKNHTIISVVLDELSWIGNRFREVHVNKLKKTLANTKLLQFQSKFSLEELVIHDYQYWAKYNILDTDVKLPISMLRDQDQFKNFCNEHKLIFDSIKVNDILCDITRYAV